MRTKLEQAMSVYNTSTAVLAQARNFYSRFKSKNTWYVNVNSKDRAYAPIIRWITENTPNNKIVSAVSYYDRSGEGDWITGWETGVGKSNTIDVDGHSVKVTILRGNGDVSDDDDSLAANGDSSISLANTAQFACDSSQAQAAVKKFVEKISGNKSDRRGSVYFLGRFGWDSLDSLPPRTLDSVILKEGQLDRLSADLKKFLASEDQYNKLAVPWHRGYLLHGPAGTGKTSAIRALAYEHKLDLWYLSLSAVKDDSDLIQAISRINSRGIVLLEDVDVFHAVSSRKDERDGALTLAGLLNSLDGVTTPHGLIVVMTTNNKESLDEALIRKGRVDLEEYIGLPDLEQISRMFLKFYEADFPLTSIPENFSTSWYYEIFKTNIGDPDAAIAEIEKNL